MDLILVVFPVIMIMCGALLLFFLLKIGSLKKELQISRKCFIMSYPKEYILLGIILFLVNIAFTSLISIHGLTAIWTIWHTVFSLITGLLGFGSIVILAVFSTFKIVVSKDVIYIYHVFTRREDIEFSDISLVEREYRYKGLKAGRTEKKLKSKLKIYHKDNNDVFIVDESMTGFGVFVKMLEKNGIDISDNADILARADADNT